MTSLGGLHSHLVQNVVPVAQAASEFLISSATRTLGSGTSRAHTPGNHQAEEKHKICKEVALLDELGLCDLPRALPVSRLSPLLACRKCADLLQPQEAVLSLFWRQKNASSASFFENKTGFPESDLHLYRPLLAQAHCSLHNPLFHQHVRGFKSKASNRGSGALGKRRTEESALRQKAKDLNEWLWGKPKHTGKMRELITDKTQSPESAEKIKIAFAEGYAANAGAAGPNWKRIVRIGLILAMVTYATYLYLLSSKSKSSTQQSTAIQYTRRLSI